MMGLAPSLSRPADPPDNMSGDASFALPPEPIVPEAPPLSQPPSPAVPASPEPAAPFVPAEGERGFRSSKSAPMICAQAAMSGNVVTPNQRLRLISPPPNRRAGRLEHKVVHW